MKWAYFKSSDYPSGQVVTLHVYLTFCENILYSQNVRGMLVKQPLPSTNGPVQFTLLFVKTLRQIYERLHDLPFPFPERSCMATTRPDGIIWSKPWNVIHHPCWAYSCTCMSMIGTPMVWCRATDTCTWQSLKDKDQFWSCDCIVKETLWNRSEKVDHLAHKVLVCTARFWNHQNDKKFGPVLVKLQALYTERCTCTHEYVTTTTHALYLSRSK